MASFYYGYMDMLFRWLNKKSLQITEVFTKRELTRPSLRAQSITSIASPKL